MFGADPGELSRLIGPYGSWIVGVVVCLESMGLPLPGETMIIAAGIYAASHPDLNIAHVIAAAACGAILGDNIGYILGRTLGYALLRRYGRYVGLDARRIEIGRYLLARYGGLMVFFGRFIAILRTCAAWFAGAGGLSWGRFLLFNALGGIVWTTLYGLGGYLLGNEMRRIVGPLGIALAVVGGGVILIGIVAARRTSKRLEAEIEQTLAANRRQSTAPPRCGSPHDDRELSDGAAH